MILVGLPETEAAKAASSGNDSALSGKVRAGYFYGASDPRRPSGAAIGY